MSNLPIDPVAELEKSSAQGALPAHCDVIVPPNTEDMYLIVKMRDGNYTGYALKGGKQIKVRDVGPETVLQLLLTHDGK